MEQKNIRNHALAQAFLLAGDYEKALDYTLHPVITNSPISIFVRMSALLKSGKYEAAAELFEMKYSEIPAGPLRAEFISLGMQAYYYLGDQSKRAILCVPVIEYLNYHPTITPYTGQSVCGKTIIIFCGDEGLGDYIKVARYIPLLADAGGRVIVQVDKSLHRLFSTIPGVLACETLEAGPAADYWVRSGYLAGFSAGIGCVPVAPYIAVPPIDVEAEGLKVGLSWGCSWTTQHMIRSCALSELSPLSTIDGVALFSLQKGPEAKQLYPPPAGMKITDLAYCSADFYDTARAIAAMDVVVSTCNVVANLAGAMGKPVMVLLQKNGDPRWRDPKGFSWYPSATVFRQDKVGEWGPPIQRIAAAISELARVKAVAGMPSEPACSIEGAAK